MGETDRQAPEHAHLLVLEDEFILRLDLEDLLDGLGYRVAASVARSSEALAVIESSARLDGALLDVELAHGEHTYPIGEVLAARSVPYLFMTGHHPRAIDPRFAHVPVLQKPFTAEALEQALRGLLQGLRSAKGAGTGAL